MEYSIEDVSKLEEKYKDDKYKLEDSVVSKKEEYPTIIIIMNESFSDLSIYGDNYQVSEEVLSFYNELEENAIKGYTLTSIFGSGTANSEYEVLTGNAMMIFPRGAYVYNSYVNGKSYSLFSALKQYGYKVFLCIIYMGVDIEETRYIRIPLALMSFMT